MLMRWILWFVLATVAFWLMGCSQMNEVDAEQQREVLMGWVDAGKAAGVEVYGFIRVPNEGHIKNAIGHNGEAVIFMRFVPED